MILLPDQYVHLIRAEISVGDYFCFLRLPLRTRNRFKHLADLYYKTLEKHKIKTS